jgi:hypothetical protein
MNELTVNTDFTLNFSDKLQETERLCFVFIMLCAVAFLIDIKTGPLHLQR